MREIKFRAWDVSNAKMIVVDQMTFRTNGDVFNVWDSKISDNVPGLLINPTSGILIQYAGLKDKYNKEIYEGDIVRNPDAFKCRTSWGDCKDNFPTTRIVQFNEDNVKFELVFIEECIRDRGTSGLMFCMSNEDLFEIIGNIYENPELLGVTK